MLRRANKADVAVWFDVSTQTVDAWIRRGCPAIQRGRVGAPWVFDLRDVAEWRYAGTSAHDPDEVTDPESMPPRDRKDWYDGEEKRIRVEKERGTLVSADIYREEMSRVLKEIAITLETLPDVLERKCNLSPDAVLIMQKILDDQRTQLANRIAA